MSACIEGRIDDAFDGDFTDFYSAHYAKVYSRLLRLGARHADAEEIAQEAMLRTWRKRDTHANEDHRRSFVHTVASTLYIDLLRRADSHTVPLDDYDVAYAGESPPEAAARAEERRALGSALLRLPLAERQLLIDAEVHDLDPEELTERYGAKKNALRIRRFRTRRALRVQLAHLRAAPAVLYFQIGRRLEERGRAVNRWFHDFGDTLTPQVIARMIATLSLLAVPFGANPLRPAPAYAEELRPRDAFAPRYGLTTDRALSEVVPRGFQSPRSRRTGPPRIEPPRLPIRPTLPSICVGSACTPGGNPSEPGDVLVLHLPAPIGDREVRQNVAAICEWTPDSAVADCHTEGKPDYRVPPPPRP